MRYRVVFLLVLLLAGCGGDPRPPAQQPAGPVTLEQIAAGEVDGKTVTVEGVYYERGESKLLVPALSFVTPGGPTPLLRTVSEAVTLNQRPEGELLTAGEVRYAPVRVTGSISPGEPGRALTISTSKVLVPLEVQPATLAQGSFEGQAVLVRATLLSRPGQLLMAEEVGSGGVPSATSNSIKVLMTHHDDALLATLAQGSGEARYGLVEAVGIWRSGVLYLLWAEPAE